MMMMMMMMMMLFRLFPLLPFSLGCVFANETNDIVDLANCDGAADGRTDTSYRDAEAHLKTGSLTFFQPFFRHSLDHLGVILGIFGGRTCCKFLIRGVQEMIFRY